MSKFDSRILDLLGFHVNKDKLAGQCEINSIAYKNSKPVNTSDLLQCNFKFVEFEKMPIDIGRCFCGRKIEICFVINHIETGKQFVLGKDCLFVIFGDRLKKQCTKCGLVSSKSNRVRSNGLCKSCAYRCETARQQKIKYAPVSFDFSGSSKDKYYQDKHALTRRVANTLIKFGKYKYQMTPAEIREKDPKYFNWLVNTVDSMMCLKD